MINDQLSAPLPQSHAELRSLEAIGKLLQLLSDPQASSARVKELQDAATKHRTLLDSIKAESKSLDDKRAQHTAALAAERAAHDEKLRTERIAFDAECARRATVLHEAEEKAAAAQAAADTARLHAVAISTDLENRLALIASASTAPLPARH
jgi:hypothetical protein